MNPGGDTQLDFSWNGFYRPDEEHNIREHVAQSVASDKIHTCTCGILQVSVFGDWLNNTFDAFIFCDCGRLGYQRAHGALRTTQLAA